MRLPSQFELVDSCVAFPLPASESDCAAFCGAIAAALAGADGSVGAELGSSAWQLLVRQRLALRLPVGAFGSTVGWALFHSRLSSHGFSSTVTASMPQLTCGPVHTCC